MDNLIDRTKFFKALEYELHLAKSKSTNLPQRIDEANQDLAHFFENKKTLAQALNIGALTFEHAFLCAKADNPWFAKLVLEILSELRKARDKAKSDFFAFWADRMISIAQSIDNTASAAVLQGSKSELEPSALVKSYFRDIGDLLEGSLQPLIRLRLEILGILGKRKENAPTIERITFGAATDELINICTPRDTYKPPPQEISISQWRNIANHNSYKIDRDKIICRYGPTEKTREFSITFDELATQANHINDLCYAHKIAFEIFSIDNIEKLKTQTLKVSPSDFSINTALAYGLVSSGFSVVQSKQASDCWHFIIIDKYSRRKMDAKLALQAAVYAYLLFVNPMEFKFKVISKKTTHNFSFLGSIKTKGDSIPPGFAGEMWKVGENFRLGAPSLFKNERSNSTSDPDLRPSK